MTDPEPPASPRQQDRPQLWFLVAAVVFISLNVVFFPSGVDLFFPRGLDITTSLPNERLCTLRLSAFAPVGSDALALTAYLCDQMPGVELIRPANNEDTFGLPLLVAESYKVGTVVERPYEPALSEESAAALSAAAAYQQRFGQYIVILNGETSTRLWLFRAGEQVILLDDALRGTVDD